MPSGESANVLRAREPSTPMFALNYGEVYRALKDEGVAPELAAEYAGYAAQGR